MLGLAIDNTLRHRPLPATTPDTDAVNNITLSTKNTKLSKIKSDHRGKPTATQFFQNKLVQSITQTSTHAFHFYSEVKIASFINRMKNMELNFNMLILL